MKRAHSLYIHNSSQSEVQFTYLSKVSDSINNVDSYEYTTNGLPVDFPNNNQYTLHSVMKYININDILD